MSDDAGAIEVVKNLRHRVDGRHSCKCDECAAIKRVCALASEAIAIKASRRSTSVRPEYTADDVWLLRYYADSETCKCKYHGGGLASIADRIQAALPAGDTGDKT